MLKYSKENPNSKDKAITNFMAKVQLDLVEVPEEFKDVETDDLVIRRDRRARRKVIRHKTSRDLSKYDAWICSDR